MAGIKIPYTYTYQQYPFSEEATRLSKNLANRRERRKVGHDKVYVIILGTCFIGGAIMMLGSSLLRLDSVALQVTGMVIDVVGLIVAALLTNFAYNKLTELSDKKTEDKIDAALERDLQLLSLYSDEYRYAYQAVMQRRVLKEQRKAKK